MGKILVTLNGVAIQGAIVAVLAPPVLFGIGGYDSNGTTDSKGMVEFPDPSIATLPQGSSADVSSRWTDSKGNKYYASGAWEVVANWNIGTGFEGWSPDPLALALSPTGEVDPSVVATVDKNIDTSQKSTKGTNLNDQLTTLVWVAVAIVALYLFLELLVPALRKEKGGAAA